jgi:predicted nucleic acid-binding Zn ribbon protein
MPRPTRDEPDEEDDDPSGEYDAYRDYDPEDEETYPEGLYNDDGPATIPCPYCKRPISEEAQMCPHCENFVSREDAPPSGKSWFVIVVLVLALIIAVMWVAAP